MPDKTATCEACKKVKPIRLMRFVKYEDGYKYLCNECRSLLK